MVSDVARSNLDDPDIGVRGAAEMYPSASVDAGSPDVNGLEDGGI